MSVYVFITCPVQLSLSSALARGWGEVMSTWVLLKWVYKGNRTVSENAVSSLPSGWWSAALAGNGEMFGSLNKALNNLFTMKQAVHSRQETHISSQHQSYTQKIQNVQYSANKLKYIYIVRHYTTTHKYTKAHTHTLVKHIETFPLRPVITKKTCFSAKRESNRKKHSLLRPKIM